MLKKLLNKRKSSIQLLGAVFGTAAGMLLVLLAIQLYIDIDGILNRNTQIFDPDVVTITKQIKDIRQLETESQKKGYKVTNDFTAKEAEELAKQPFVEETGLIKSTHFKAWVKVVIPFVNRVRNSYITFESLPEGFLKDKPAEWKWEKEGDPIPIILPMSFLKLYNFGYAAGANRPPLTKKMIKTISLYLNIIGETQSLDDQKLRIAGFNDASNTILIHPDFLNWANKKYGSKSEVGRASGIMARSNPKTISALKKYCHTHQLHISGLNEKNGKGQMLLQAISGLALLIGVVIVFLALLVFLQSFQLLIAKSHEDLILLFQLGYSYQAIRVLYIKRFLNNFLISLIVTFGLLFYLKSWVHKIFEKYGFEVSNRISPEMYIYGLLFAILFITLNSININMNLKRVATFST